MTEEDRYSSVVREAPQQPYSQPQQRFQLQQQQQSQLAQQLDPQQQQQPLGAGIDGGQPASQDVRLSPTAAAAAATAALVDGNSNAAPSLAKPPAWGNAGAGVAVLRCGAGSSSLVMRAFSFSKSTHLLSWRVVLTRRKNIKTCTGYQ